MLDIRKLKELVRLMVSHDLTEIDLRDSEEQVTLRRHGPGGAPIVMTAPAHAAHHHPVPAASVAVHDEPPAADDLDLPSIDSPMVGTFYPASSPDARPFVEAGSTVGPDTVVCLIEAMKIFNEIKAECSGTIERVLVDSGDAVEFGQKLFLVRPA